MTGERRSTGLPRRAPIHFAWIGACALGEAAGLVAAGAVNAFVAPRLAAAGAEPWVLHGLLVVAGGLEGAFIGLAQWAALRRLVPGIGAAAWILATSLGAATGWLVGSSVSVFEPTMESPLSLLALVGAATGVVLGLAVGIAQAMVLWKHVPRTGAWVLVNGLAWMIGMIVTMLGARALPPGGYGLEALLIGIATGAGVGITVGAITGVEVGRWGNWSANSALSSPFGGG